ncbi:MAG: hypothetical protein AAF658_21130, partial [Myxococcota bacterium]
NRNSVGVCDACGSSQVFPLHGPIDLDMLGEPRSARRFRLGDARIFLGTLGGVAALGCLTAWLS